MSCSDLISPTPVLRFQRSIRPRLGSFALWCSVVWTFAVLGAFSAPASGTEAPDPAEGEWAEATIALLNHQKEICDVLVVRIIDHWQGLPPVASKEDDEERIREHVLERQLSDLAASRSAGDLVERFLPGVRRETNSETAASIRRLDGLIGELCDAVALPVSPVEAFEQKITEILERVEVEQAELGRLLVVPDAVEQAALEPYLLPIQKAGIEAEGEYLAYLESIKPKAKEPTIRDRMHAWHLKVYSPAVAASKKAFGTYIGARNKNDGRTMGRACREMNAAVSILLRDESVFEAPDPRLREPLRKIYVAMRQLGKECVAGRPREVQAQFGNLSNKLKDAGAQMSRYGLSP